MVGMGEDLQKDIIETSTSEMESNKTPTWEIVGVVSDEPLTEGVDITAAGWLWAVLEAIEFDSDGEPEGYEMHERVKAFAREQWPWLAEAAEKYYDLNVADDE